MVAPLAACDGRLLRRVDDRYAVCVFPFLAGRSYRFGTYTDPLLRGRALDMIAALHQATPAVRGLAPRHVPSFAGRDDLDAFLLDPGRAWAGGPFSEPARRLLVTRTADLAQLAAAFDRLAAATAAARAGLVITHGEPHPANLMSVGGRLVLIDWDTAALAPPERDVSLIATTSGEGIDHYQQAVGRDLDPPSSPCTGRAGTSTTWPAPYACSATSIAIHPTPGCGGTAWHPGWNSFPDGYNS